MTVGDEISCGGVVKRRTVREDGTVVVELEVWADKQTGERLVVAEATVPLTG
ncbi:hypothetical protein C5F59_006795 [Streptomyces sp. QL37]|uniref:hypothetical protein n=1 Tax=Streptomyces sp. QL37 TaxID=2093747 RepID=UPI001374B50E|nr:hypothetical protein [Streptomyces sp. QL37]